MASKRKILEAVSREGLLDVARSFEITGLTGRSKADIIDALVAARSLHTEEILGLFSRDDLKAICRGLEYDDAGREKQVLIDRLLGKTESQEQPTPAVTGKGEQMAKKKPAAGDGLMNVEDYRHKGAKRKNNPPAKIAAEGVVPPVNKIQYSYSPRRPPVLRFDTSGAADKLPELLAEAKKRKLTDDEVRLLAEALRTQEPWLEWAGKSEAEAKGFSVDPIALHIHERISAQAILRIAARQDVQRTLFADPEQEYHEAVQFYQHNIDWTNRLILGDSLHVMASLVHREDLAGKVQMIYMDPPYGIKYGSNFQSEVGRRDVKDKEADLTRELEMVKAYRDTWHIGIHSYLTYLRARLLVAREMLADSGSVFVQISDENLHHVRELLDDVFGRANFCSVVAYKTTGGQASELLASVCDYLIWYAKDIEKIKYHKVFTQKVSTGEVGRYQWLESPDGTGLRALSNDEIDNPLTIQGEYRLLVHDNITSQGISGDSSNPFSWNNTAYKLPTNSHWKTTPAGMERLAKANRLMAIGATLRFKRLLDDFPVSPIDASWQDTAISGFGRKKQYVVETNAKVIERCLLMTTDPGDICLDPTCGSGTTAFIAEQWGRRWITIDTSRVAVAIARQRLLTAKYDYYNLRDEKAGVSGGFKYKTVPHITLKSIGSVTY